MSHSVLRPQVSGLSAFLVEAIIALGTLIQALLSAYLLITHGLTDLARAWPPLFTGAAHLLLWPLARLADEAPGQIGIGTILVAMALYLAMTLAGIGAVNLLTRQPPAPTSTQRGWR